MAESTLVDPSSGSPEPRFHPPGDKVATSATSMAAASLGAKATASVTTAGAGIQRVVTGFSFSMCASVFVATATIGMAIWDGPTGSTLLWGQVVAVGSGGIAPINVTGVNLLGSAASQLTADFTAAVSNATQFVSFQYHDLGV